MKAAFALFAILVISTSAMAATAFWTGRSESIITVTNQQASKCEYDYAGQKFWRVFKGPCPASVEVE